jgi:GntR family transcriptional regulator, transcriptional repressor for pyruvate dehydrogenase complex
VLKPLSRINLAGQAAEAIKRFIIHEQLASGDQLPSEKELTEALAVSRNIIREALTTLVAEGMIVKQAGKGTFVRDFDRAQVSATLSALIGQRRVSAQELHEFRIALEIGALELVVRRITGEQLQKIARILERYERKQKEGKSVAKEDIDFHLALLKATENDGFREMAPVVAAGFRERVIEYPAAIRRSGGGRNNVENHWAILRALEGGDLAAAQAAMRTHFSESAGPTDLET